MHKFNWMKRLTLLAVMALLLGILPLAVQAQDATPEEHSTPVAEESHGEETDAGHGETTDAAAEEAVSPLTPLGINAGYLFVQIVNFLVIFGGLTALIWRPAMNFLDARSATIAKGLEDAAQAAKDRQNAEQEAEKIRADARAEAAKIISEARGTGEKLAKDEEARGRGVAEKIRADAMTEAQTLKENELSGLRDQVVGVAVALAGRIIQENLKASDKKQAELISEFLSKVPSGAKGLTGKVEVTSAITLSDAEKGKVKGELGASDVDFKVDPTILGGLVIRAQDKLIDGSVKSNLEELSGRLN